METYYAQDTTGEFTKRLRRQVVVHTDHTLMSKGIASPTRQYKVRQSNKLAMVLQFSNTIWLFNHEHGKHLTPRAYKGGKVISSVICMRIPHSHAQGVIDFAVFVVINKTIARSRQLCILASAHHYEHITSGEKVTKLIVFKALYRP